MTTVRVASRKDTNGVIHIIHPKQPCLAVETSADNLILLRNATSTIVAYMSSLIASAEYSITPFPFNFTHAQTTRCK